MPWDESVRVECVTVKAAEFFISVIYCPPNVMNQSQNEAAELVGEIPTAPGKLSLIPHVQWPIDVNESPMLLPTHVNSRPYERLILEALDSADLEQINSQPNSRNRFRDLVFVSNPVKITLQNFNEEHRILRDSEHHRPVYFHISLAGEPAPVTEKFRTTNGLANYWAQWTSPMRKCRASVISSGPPMCTKKLQLTSRKTVTSGFKTTKSTQQ